MTSLAFRSRACGDRLGLKGPRAGQWLAARGIAVPPAPNTWMSPTDPEEHGLSLLVAQLGIGEFFLEDRVGGSALRGMEYAPESHPPGVYPVVREDCAFLLSGDDSHAVLAQVCNVNFAELVLKSRPVVMTLMIGVAVLVVPESAGAERRYRIWCDPTFGRYLDDKLGEIVEEFGGVHGGVPA